MADMQIDASEGQRVPRNQPAGNGIGADELPDDVDALRALVLEERKKSGTLINENKAAKKAREELSGRLKSWNRLEEEGYTAEQIQQILGKQEQQDLDKARDKGEIDKLLDNQRKKFEKDLAEKDKRIEAEMSLNNKVLLDNVLREELAKVCDPDLLNGAFALHRPQIIMIEDPETDYGRKAVASVGGEHMQVGDFVKNWAETNEKAISISSRAWLAAAGPAAAASKVCARLGTRTR